jgi:hypothetical protein
MAGSHCGSPRLNGDDRDADLALLQRGAVRPAVSLPNADLICQDWVLYLCGRRRADLFPGMIAGFGEALVAGDSGS